MRPDAYTFCNSCGAKIFFAKTPAGKEMPIDLEPSIEGNIDLSSGEAVVVKRSDFFPVAPLYISHFATCPHAGQHRRKTT